MTTDNGGPAFPGAPKDMWIPSPHGGMDRASAWGWDPEQGMSLRDWFAGMAMQGMANSVHHCAQVIADRAYEVADAMLEERKR